MNITIIDREMTSKELARMNSGFDEHTLANSVAIQSSERFGFVGLDGNSFVGCSSGLAYKNGENYSGWFYLTDLFVEKEYRFHGVGAKLLTALEEKLLTLGVRHIWTWTAGYEAPKFYGKHGYVIFTEMENWYSDGSSRVGFRKEMPIT